MATQTELSQDTQQALVILGQIKEMIENPDRYSYSPAEVFHALRDLKTDRFVAKPECPLDDSVESLPSGALTK